MGNEAITVTVSEFKAGKNAGFLKNKKIEKLFVEYRYFLWFKSNLGLESFIKASL